MPVSLSALSAFNVALIRHGNTAPAASDLDRALTDLGRQQANRAAAGGAMRRNNAILLTNR